MTEFKEFEDFWPFYLSQHSSAANRWIHFFGLNTALIFALGAVAAGRWGIAPLGLVFGYAPAWFGHFVIEKNRPATFRYPRWSLMGDFRMCWLMWTGQLKSELHRMQAHV